MPRSPVPPPDSAARLHRLLRRLALRLERGRVAARAGELAGLADVPHDIGDAARARLARLARRERALARLGG